MSDGDTDVSIRRLTLEDAAAVVDCFRRVYGDSYANELFYDSTRLAERHGRWPGWQRRGGKQRRRGAWPHGHDRAQLVRTWSSSAIRWWILRPGVAGLAWQVGAELSSWCRELGYQGFLHYPTTDHHIMQRQSVKAGFETGLMLGYIPAETHGKVGADAAAQAPGGDHRL